MKESRGLGEGRAVLAVEKNNLAQVLLPTTATLRHSAGGLRCPTYVCQQTLTVALKVFINSSLSDENQSSEENRCIFRERGLRVFITAIDLGHLSGCQCYISGEFSLPGNRGHWGKRDSRCPSSCGTRCGDRLVSPLMAPTPGGDPPRPPPSLLCWQVTTCFC